MWKQNQQLRNCYLQIHLPTLQADALNDYVNDEFKKNCKEVQQNVSFKNLPIVKSKYLFDDRSKLAFGFWGLQKIIKEICSDDSRVQRSAMNTLSELLLNKLECQRAISEFDIVRRLQNILLRRRIQTHKDQSLIPLILKCFEILASSLRASIQISKRPNLVYEFYSLVKKGDGIASLILKALTLHPYVLDYFIRETSWFNELSMILKRNVIALVNLDLLEHFSHFLRIQPQMAIAEGFFEIIFIEIPKRQSAQKTLLKCFSLVLNCKEGQDKLEECDGIRVMYEVLLDDQLDTHEFICQAFQNATAGSKILLWRCREFWNLSDALIRRAHNKENDFQQLYCLQTLRQITTMPSVKKYVRAICLPQIENIECRKEIVEEAKTKLVIWLKSEIYNRNT